MGDFDVAIQIHTTDDTAELDLSDFPEFLKLYYRSPEFAIGVEYDEELSDDAEDVYVFYSVSTPRNVMRGLADATLDRLEKENLKLNKKGNAVGIYQSAIAKNRFENPNKRNRFMKCLATSSQTGGAVPLNPIIKIYGLSELAAKRLAVKPNGIVGTPRQVMYGDADLTLKGQTANDLTFNKVGQIVGKNRSHSAKKRAADKKKWNKFMKCYTTKKPKSAPVQTTPRQTRSRARQNVQPDPQPSPVRRSTRATKKGGRVDDQLMLYLLQQALT